MGIPEIIMLILSLIGALPDFIAALQKLWDMIKGVRDPATRRTLKRQWVGVALHGVDRKNPKPRTAEAFAQAVSSLLTLQRQVTQILTMQHVADHEHVERLAEIHGLNAAHMEKPDRGDSPAAMGLRANYGQLGKQCDKPQSRG